MAVSSDKKSFDIPYLRKTTRSEFYKEVKEIVECRMQLKTGRTIEFNLRKPGGYESAVELIIKQGEEFKSDREYADSTRVPAEAARLFGFHRSTISATTSLVDNLRSRTTLPEGPDVELHDVEPIRTATKVEEIVSRWVKDGFCRLDEILVLSPHGTRAKTSLANQSMIGEWPVVGIDERNPSSLVLLSINKAKGLDSLAVIMIDVERFEQLATPQEQMNYFMGASRARQLLAILHKTES